MLESGLATRQNSVCAGPPATLSGGIMRQRWNVRKAAHCAAFLSAGLVLGSALAGTALADASSAEYRGCDGYGAASGEGDGMTSYASFLLIFNPPGYGNTDTSKTSPGRIGVERCDAALSDLPERHWMRKVSLLRSRALHRLENYDAPGAMADLDLAQAAVKDASDPFYARSLGLSVTLVRALALRISGAQDEAETLALQAVAARPYNRQVLLSAMTAMGPGAKAEHVRTIRQAIARLVPDQSALLFFEAFEAGDFAEAIKLYPQLIPPTEIGDINLSVAEAAGRAWRDFETARNFWAWHDGAYAYALATSGQGANARAALVEARNRLARDTAPLPPMSAEDARDTEKAALDKGNRDIRLHAAAEGGQTLDEWTRMVEWRLMLAEGKAVEVAAALRTQKMAHSWAAADLMDALMAQIPEKQRPTVSPSITIKERLKREWASKAKLEPADMFERLPAPETARRIPPYEEAVTSFLGSDRDTEGFRTAGPDERGVITISYRGLRTVPSTVEEMALLAAADFVRKQGKTGMIILRRGDVRFTEYTTQYGVPLRSDPKGFQTEFALVAVDLAALPAQYADARWRVIDADQVYASLAPLYIPPPKSRR